ncbi:MAG: diaminopimelate decarboxylase [Alphaproteobacteria bacterium]
MNKKNIPFTKEQVASLATTPFYVYDKKAMLDNASKFINAFSWAKGFKNFFAVKALPNPSIIKALNGIGMGCDCSSLTELMMAEKLGLSGNNIMFTSNNTPVEEFVKAKELSAIINFDDITHIKFYEENIGELPETVCFRYNPGALKEGNDIIGNPREAKYGLTLEQMFEAYEYVKSKGVKRLGLHTMVASNETNADYFVETAKIIFELALRLKKEKNIQIDFINLGGGLGIPYFPYEKPLDIQEISDKIKAEYNALLKENGLEPELYFECGRYVTGPYGYLVTKAIHKKETYKNYIGVDACMVNLMRPALYGAYHHISVMGKENEEHNYTYDVVGALCENNDKFAIDRALPKIENGDFLVISDAGAHGSAMGFNYNGKLKCAEYFLNQDGSFEMIRRAETPDDYFATLNF